MSKKMTCVFLIVSFLVAGVLTISPPRWPEAFSQSVLVQFNDPTATVTSGKLWYDSNLGAQRYDFADGKTKFACGVISTGSTSCTLLTTNRTLYIVLPEKNLCCNAGPAEIIDRNWLQNYTYVGESTINNEDFHEWEQLLFQQSPKYFADKSQQMIPRRFSFKKIIVMDYLKNSYSQRPIPTSIFNVPSRCQRDCSTYIAEKDTQLKQQFQQRLKVIKKWTIILKEQTKNYTNLLREQ